MVLLCLVLGVAVWFDNRPSDKPKATQPSLRAEVRRETPAELAVETAEPRGDAARFRNPLATVKKSDLQETVLRPLFAPSRHRPAVAAPRPVVEAPPPKQRDRFDLLGVLKDNERAVAVIRDKNDGASFRVERGDMIAGWRVAKIQSTSVVLEQTNGETVTVPLYRQ